MEAVHGFEDVIGQVAIRAVGPAGAEGVGHIRDTDAPTLIVAHTVKGKGVSFMEGQYPWHSKPITDDDLRQALEELDGRAASRGAKVGP